ncbi:MAG TPA: cyclic nucleotide-binding domain-containing protein [Candidatus Eisenbacteria bacterium]|nr:cyclic nucleotide-binding domain-containing protein [Candidatus Eisenbacteria bacterium]
MQPNLMLLSQVPLFAGVGPEGLEEIAGIAREKDVPAGTVLTHEGRHEGYFFVVIEGIIRIERGGQTINTLGPGDFLGEIALLDDGPRTATATTETPCRLLSLMPEQFHQLMIDLPTVQTALLQSVAQHLRKLDDETPI